MKKHILISIQLVLILAAGSLKAQESRGLTPNGIFDKAYDRLGREYPLSDININSGKPLGGSNTINSVPTITCIGGYFKLYFAPGSFFASSTAAQTVICQLFTDISNFIPSPLTASGVKINIYCGDTPTNSPNLGTASSIYVFPGSPASSNPGIIDNQIYKAITTGIDPYLNLPIAALVGANNFYAGYIQANPSVNWNLTINTPTINSSQYDFYSLMLHEATHALGFASLISSGGISAFGAANNYFSRYDPFLVNSSGNPLLATSTTLCPINNVSFQGSTLSIASGACTNTLSQSDLTSCGAAVKYASPSVTVAVYTPTCYEPGSSLSHFEDLCPIPSGGTISAACLSAYGNSPNNLYYNMSNLNGTGDCFIKRYLKEEERKVLCDLGYTVLASYSSSGSNAAIDGTMSTHPYSAGACSPSSPIYGINDGLNNSAYVFTTNGTSTVIPYSTLLANDYPTTGLQVSCLEAVYNNATVTTGATNFTVTANSGAGLVLLKYLPKNTSGKVGNATYVYVFFIPGNCNPPNSCNMVQNGGFENLASGSMCGYLISSIGYTAPLLSCWDMYDGTCDLFTRNCTTPVLNTICDLGTSTFGTSPPMDSFSGAPNNRIIGGAVSSSSSESVKNNLSTPLVNGQSYQLSFLVCNNSPTVGFNSNYSPIVISVASNSVFSFVPPAAFPNNLTSLVDFTVPSSFGSNNWISVTNTFVFSSSPTVNASALIIGGNPVKSAAVGLVGSSYYFLDEISLMPIPSTTFALPQSTTCIPNISFTNLAQYASGVPGTFSGAGVTFSNNIYYFNASSTLVPGSYPIAFTYTISNCVNTIWQNVFIPGLQSTLVTPCTNSYVLSVQGFQAGATFNWLPSGQTGPMITVNNLTATTVYSLIATQGTCSTTHTILLNGIPPTFTNVPSSWCLNQPNTFLENFLAAGVPTVGSFFAGGLSTSTANVNGVILTSVSISPTVSPGVYTVTYAYNPSPSSPCFYFSTFTVNVVSGLNIPSSQSITACTNLNPQTTLSVNVNAPIGATYTWQPGNLSGANPTISPSSNTIYTVTVNNGNCSAATQTVSVVIYTNCCSPSIPSFTATSIAASTTLSTARTIINSFTVQPGQNLEFSGAQFLFAPGVKITVDAANLTITNSHLYACSGDMWDGIVLLNGSNANIRTESLIEDAKIAIDIPGVGSNTIAPNVEVKNTVFNKNYMSIRISNFPSITGNYPFLLYRSVFTCRSLTFSPTTWPNTGTTSSVSTSNAELRHAFASTPTTGLNPPYLNQSTFTITTLKHPYSNQPSHIAIQVNSVGVTSNTLMYGINIGSSSGSSFFNIFDAHGNFIVASRSNVTLNNNVFQNTRTYTVSSTPFGGSAVKHAAVYNSTDVMRTKLDMPATSLSLGNRFWNCHRGIELKNTYLFWLEYALFRSTQSTANVTGFLPGNIGIYAPTNNFDYYIANNEFTNLKTAINIPISSGFIAPQPSPWQPPTVGIYAYRIRITSNTFAAGTGTNTYMERAVDMTCPNSTPWQSSIFIVPGVSVTPFTQAFSITNNTLDRVFRGISLNGSHGFQIDVSNNNIILTQDNVVNSGLDQYGVQLTNCMPTSASVIGKNIVSRNEISFSVAPTSTAGGLIYCGDNGYGVASPSVSCNSLTKGYQGFVFDGINNNALWGGNNMTTPLARGMVLSNNAVIGTQGSTNTAIANRWVGGAGSWNGANYATYVTSGSQAVNSQLYVRNVSTYTPSNSSGPINSNNYALNNGYKYMTYVNGGDYVCGDFPNNKISLPQEDEFESALYFYKTKSALYRFLNFNDSVNDSDPDVKNFYDGQEGSSIDKFLQVEKLIYQGNAEEAEEVLNEIDDSNFNTIETRYKDFYSLYLEYLNLGGSQEYSPTSKSLLKTLAQRCPGQNGPAIYQAISLYNTIYGEILFPNCSSVGARVAGDGTIVNETNNIRSDWRLDLYPNPARNQVTLVSSVENDELRISIWDLSGRKVLSETIKLKDFMSKLELDLMNGAYFINVKNSTHEEITKKLIIAK